MLRIELRTILDPGSLREILGLIDATTAIEGHRPVGEHKYSHLAVGASGWVGVLAYDHTAAGDRLVGYAHTRWNPLGARPRIAVEVVVHPDYQDDTDVARRLLEETRSVLGRAGGGLLYLWVHRVDDPEKTLAADMGFQVQRELAFLVRDLHSPPPAATFPPDVTVRPYAGPGDDEELLRVNNAAFFGHPENGNWDADEFAGRREREWFDPDGLLMAWRGDDLVGFHWTKWHGHDSDEIPAHEPVGEVYVLAVDPSARGEGLGRALLLAGLGHLHARGCRQAVLYVDFSNEHAVRLYTAHGFAVESKEVCYEEWVPPLVESAAADLWRPAF
jgi:mycothiol synthase